MRRMSWCAVLIEVLVAGMGVPSMLAQWNPPNPVVGFEKRADGLEVRQKNGVLWLGVCAEDLLHVTYSPLKAVTAKRASDDVVVKKEWAAAAFDVSSNDQSITLSTAKLRVMIERESGAVHYIVPEGATGAGATGPDRRAGRCGEGC